MRLAVTGLSSSGKTAFITSLVCNLLSAAGRPARLPFLRSAAERRIVGAKLLAPDDGTIGQFPVHDTIAALADDPPHWPPGTTDLRRVDLSLRFAPAGLIGRAAGGAAELRLEILDYPGEWLLDLPLLDKSYADWSAETLLLSRQEPRQKLAEAWHVHLATLDPEGASVTVRTSVATAALRSHRRSPCGPERAD